MLGGQSNQKPNYRALVKDLCTMSRQKKKTKRHSKIDHHSESANEVSEDASDSSTHYALERFWNALPDYPQHTLRPRLPYEPTDPSLGILEKLPTEIRQAIYELALDVAQPVKIRKCCGFLSDDNKRICRVHDRELIHYRRSRFALLKTSRAVKQEASWALHHKAVLELGISTAMLHSNIPSEDWKLAATMWQDSARFRRIELVLPGELVRFNEENDHTMALRTVVGQMVDNWKARSDRSPESVTHEVAIHLGRLFSESRPFNPTVRPSMMAIADRLRLLCWNNLEATIKLIAIYGRGEKWTFTAMSEIDAELKGGQNALAMLKKWLSANGIRFQGKSAEEVPRQEVLESKGAMGGTHRRFVD